MGEDLERESVVMDTPERKQQISSSPLSKFEDSPVFNYLNNLSPIKPVKSTHSTHTFNSLSFASLPSVFTSPHVSSLKESRFLRRHQPLDPSKHNFASEKGNEVGRNEEAGDIAHVSTEKQQKVDSVSTSANASAEPPYESSCPLQLSRTLSYECVSPDCSRTTSCGVETRSVTDFHISSTELGSYGQNNSFESEEHTIGMSQDDENIAAAGCDWENIFTDAPGLLVFDSPSDSKCLTDPSQKSFKSLEIGTSCSGDVKKDGAIDAIGLHQQHETDATSTLPENSADAKEIAEDQDVLVSLSNCIVGDISDKVDDELASNLQRGTRRRCLVFEMVGSRRKQFDDGSACGSSMISQSNDNIASDDKHLVPSKPRSDTSRCLPGIGLHLNALAATSADNKVVKHEALATGGQPLSMSCSAAYVRSSNSQEISNNCLAVYSSEKEMLPAEGKTPVVEDSAQASGYMIDVFNNSSSPKKKRRRLEIPGESETACKRCNCKKSKCLKLYCECFAAGVYCVEPCSCQECFNKPIHEDTVLATRKQIESRNPLAFAPKVIRSSDPIVEIGEESSKTPASARHKRGCNCKKSGCLKKYCECYQGGVGCSINCRCEGCKNAFGRKDGSMSMGAEEFEEEEAEECERNAIDKSLQIVTIPNDTDQNTNFTLPATPLQFGRQSVQLPVSSQNKKPPRSSILAVGSSFGGMYGSQRLGKLNTLQPQTKFEKVLQTSQDDEIPEILRRNSSPISGVKSASPNSKRVPPPHSGNTRISPSGQRSSRKLILQSIPSFPSLTPKH